MISTFEYLVQNKLIIKQNNSNTTKKTNYRAVVIKWKWGLIKSKEMGIFENNLDKFFNKLKMGLIGNKEI